jgi:hypothetical protein
VEIVPFPREEGVRFLDKFEYQVSRHVVWVLFAFALEHDILAMVHAPLDIDFKVFLLLEDT